MKFINPLLEALAEEAVVPLVKYAIGLATGGENDPEEGKRIAAAIIRKASDEQMRRELGQ